MVESGNKGYFGSIDCNNALQNMVLRNITFRNNACNSDYGGETCLWLTKTTTITFEKCNFINNFAKKSPSSRAQKPDGNKYFSGDGGGMQYGFSSSINNVNMVFRDNKAVRHGGALAIQTIQAVEIIDCLFENNIADYKSANSEMLAINNYFNLKAEGRGGAIYLNRSFSYGNNDYKMKSAKIEGCTFIQNKASDGYAIYIEGEDTGTTFVINQNTFIDNYNENTLSSEKSVISSEIYDLYEGKVVESNNFTLTNPNIIVKPLVYANHSGIPPQTPSASPIITGADMGTSTSLGNQNNIPFECPVDRGSIKVSLSCSTCKVTSGIYFIAYFEKQKITKVEFDPREIFNGETIQFFVKESVVYNEGNRSLSFNSGSRIILFEKDKTENNLKCYVPLSEIVIEDNE
ncbi:protein polyglutamylation [Tritrichomonas musculus]|uniref:Protein polyglutamylation n=1 Tax=Tritrichomonas musculus TaxID=1915356 RepID=A0ABR2HKB3_9EUKA